MGSGEMRLGVRTRGWLLIAGRRMGTRDLRPTDLGRQDGPGL